MAGLFQIFNVGVRGMSTQQSALNVTSHNVANANTEGYSRQRALIQATKPFGGTDMLSVEGPGQQGTGAQVSTIQRVRDSFLDYQIRTETSIQGEFTTKQNTLSEIESIMNEPSDKGLVKLFGKFYDAWQQLSKQPMNSNTRTVVAQQSSALANELNSIYTRLMKVKDNTNSVVQQSVFDTNSMLNQIDKLNKQIMGVKVSGQEPNDLMDKRDKLIDELSLKFGVNIDKKNFYGEDITPTVQNDTTSVLGVNDPFNNAPKNATLVSSDPGVNQRRFSYINSIDNIKDASGNPTNNYKITYYKNGDNTSTANLVTINVDLAANGDGTTATTAVVADRLKQISENRVLWADNKGVAVNGDGTKSLIDNTAAATPYNFNDLKLLQPTTGEFKGYSSVQQDTDNYISQMNRLAKVLAFSVNALHSGITNPDISGAVTTPTNPPTTDYMPFFVNSDVAKKVYDSNHDIPVGSTGLDKVLAAESSITAGNISVNESIINDVMKIKTRTSDANYAYAKDNTTEGSGDGERALLIADLRNGLMNIQDVDISIKTRNDLFTTGGNNLTGLNFQSSSTGTTMDKYYKDVVDRLGVQGQEAKRMVNNQQTSIDAFVQNRESVSGVSLDEEMANMVQFQHAYQANAKIISTCDQLLDVVINGLKR